MLGPTKQGAQSQTVSNCGKGPAALPKWSLTSLKFIFDCAKRDFYSFFVHCVSSYQATKKLLYLQHPQRLWAKYKQQLELTWLLFMVQTSNPMEIKGSPARQQLRWNEHELKRDLLNAQAVPLMVTEAVSKSPFLVPLLWQNGYLSFVPAPQRPLL